MFASRVDCKKCMCPKLMRGAETERGRSQELRMASTGTAGWVRRGTGGRGKMSVCVCVCVCVWLCVCGYVCECM